MTISFAGAQSAMPFDYGNSQKIAFRSGTATSMEGKVNLYLAPTSENDSGASTFVMEEIRNTVSALERKKVQRKGSKKAIELIRDELESRFLHHYKGLSDFSDLFKQRQYNELTAAALISIVLEALSFEHQLYFYKQQPGLELEDGTVLNIGQWGKLRSAIPSREEERSRLTAVLKALQFSPDNPLYQNLQLSYRSTPEKRALLPAEVTGMLYYRRALGFYAQRQISAAAAALERARTYYSDPKLDLVHYAILYQKAGQIDSDSTLIEPLFELYRLHPTSEISLELVRHFAKMAEYHLLEQDDKVAFEKRYDDYRRLFAGKKKILQQLKEIYFIEMAQYCAGKQKPHQVTIYLDSLTNYRPNDPQIEQILSPLLLRSLRNFKDPEDGLAVIKAYDKDFPFLRKEDLFRDLELSYRAERTRRAFDADRENQGRNYLEAFERQLAQSGLTSRSKLWITTAYTAASAFYFRNTDYVNARWLIQRALALIPGDKFLMHRQEVLRNY